MDHHKGHHQLDTPEIAPSAVIVTMPIPQGAVADVPDESGTLFTPVKAIWDLYADLGVSLTLVGPSNQFHAMAPASEAAAGVPRPPVWFSDQALDMLAATAGVNR